VNVEITDRNIKSVSQLPKIPKKKEATGQQTEISVDVFKSTMYDLFHFFYLTLNDILF